MAVVVISSDGKGDRPVGSLEVKAPVGWEDRSDPYRGASNLTGRSVREPGSPEKRAPRETDRGIVGSAEPLRSRRRPVSTPQDWTHAMFELPGVIEDGMSGRNGQRKLGTARGSPRRSRTAKASRISRDTVKSRCAREWGGWGREVMTDRDNITRTRARAPGAEDYPPSRRCTIESSSRHRAGLRADHEVHEGRTQTTRCPAYAGSRLKLATVWAGPA